jgi:hypothetical protein
MQRSGWEFDPEAFVTGMVGAITTPLGPSPTDPALAGVGRVLKELVFELPVPATVSLADVGAVMRAHLRPKTRSRPTPIGSSSWTSRPSAGSSPVPST